MIARRFAPGRPIAVAATPGGGPPSAFRWRGRARRVARVEDEWEVATGWWWGDGDDQAGAPDAAVRRRYYRLTTRDGLACVVFRDLDSGRWFLERVFD